MPKSVPPDACETMALLRLKLKRANGRLDALQRQLDTFSKNHPARIATRLDFQSGLHTSYILEAEMPPARFALAVGESLYHGRSVLDHLVWALVKANHQKPGKHNGFPILTKPISACRGEGDRDAFVRVMRKTGSKPGKLASVDVDAVALIESLQPYNRGNKPTDYLTVLNKMAREDRHHALPIGLVAMGDPKNLGARLAVPNGVAIIDRETLFKRGQRLKTGTKLERFRLSQWGRHPKVGVEADIPAPITFGDPPVTLDGLYEINRHLSELLGLFEEFF